MYNDAQYSRNPEYYEEINRKIKNKRIAYAIMLLIAAAVILGLIFGLFLSPLSVIGVSMNPTLTDGERIFVQKVMYTISVGDIVVFNAPDSGLRVVKRVAAVPGDVLYANRAVGSYLYVNGTKTTDKYFNYMNSSEINNLEITLGESQYFMLGDNYTESHDSRIYGAVGTDLIIGKVVLPER